MQLLQTVKLLLKGVHSFLVSRVRTSMTRCNCDRQQDKGKRKGGGLIKGWKAPLLTWQLTRRLK